MHATSQFKLKACTSLSVIISSLMLSAVSNAQQPSAEVESIVITGSRIARDGYNAPTPVSVLSLEDIQSDAPASIADFVNTLPSVKGSSTSSSSSGALSNGAAGIAALNLRSLGTGRTLVLFDGQRSVASASTGQVDTNTFPQSLVERVEVVTGGASAAYGSDAVGGVVNFILDRDYTGVKTSVQYGETTYGDNPSQKVEFTAGMPFADGDGHLLFSADVFRSDGVHYTSRDWNLDGTQGMLNPYRATAGQPYYIVSPNIGIGVYTPGGLITTGALKGTYFGTNGAINQLDYGVAAGNWMLGGDWDYATSGIRGTNSLAADDDRDSVFGRASYKLGDDTEVFFQASYAKYEGYSFYINPTDTNRLMYADNAYLPSTLKSALAAAGETTFRFGTSNEDFPASGSQNVRETQRYVAGIDGSFSAFNLGWDWDAYYQVGKTETQEHQNPTYNFQRLTDATDAVFHPTTGEIVCRTSIANPGNGCVPLNRFGVGVTSQAAFDYVMGEPRRDQVFEQKVAAINFSTSDIQGWAGPISVAFGAEWHSDSIDGKVDPIYSDGWKYGNYKVTTADTSVAEAYVETVFSIFEGLEFNGAARYAEYSEAGGVTTWKAGVTYTPIDDITLRATKSRDIRAPNLSELYDTGTGRTNSVNIGGVSRQFVQSLQGSTGLGPEEADSIGLGVVYQSSFLPGFSAAIDYFDIEIDGVIGSLSAENTADFCYLNGVQRYCDNIIFENGVLSKINLYYENLNSSKTKGVDYEATYRFPLFSGDLTLRALATNYTEDITDNGVTAINAAGSNAGNTPDWAYRLSAGYNVDTWSFNLTGRGVSDGVISNAYIECQSNCPASSSPYFTINDNSIPGEFYYDAYVANSFEIAGSDAEVFLSIKNLLNTDPVIFGSPASQGSENRPGYLPTNRGLYDVMGRTYRLGVRLEF